MPKNLMIVESPAKAKTIEKYLKDQDFVVQSSYGHIRDLPKGELAVDIQNDFQPTYEVDKDKKDIIKKLEELARKADTVWLATDDDREGEAISWHLKETLGLDENKAKRIVFREITKNAILNAIKNPRQIDIDLVNAQQARRILDRLVGFELSPILWKKIKWGLSAGRVQSVALRLIVEREREIEAFRASSSYKVIALFDLGNGKQLQAELKKNLLSLEEARRFLEDCRQATFHISALVKKPSKRSPAPPFTTSTLQQEASRKLGFSVAQTMTLAQRLYESGYITYMRTDSTNLSQDALEMAKQTIIERFGEKYSQPRQYKTKASGAQEAHEAIRPTDFSRMEVSSDSAEQMLYELIWRRAIASQMSDAQIERTIATIDISTRPEQLFAEGEVILFDGFLTVYMESSDDEEEDNSKSSNKALPPLQEGQALQLAELKAIERFSRPPARYTEASLVRKLEELGIGRPSTYAPIISTIQKRGYVVKESRPGKERTYHELVLQGQSIKEVEKNEIYGAEKNKLFPTNTGIVVTDFLMQHFADVMDYSFTAKIEAAFDEIAQGKLNWVKMLREFYDHFHPKVEATTLIDRKEVPNQRLLGTHPETGEPVYVKLGRYGAYVQIGEGNEDEKPKSASLRKGQLMETITLEEALELFKLPREIGNFEGKPIVANIGRFGPYLLHDGKFYSLGKEDDPLTVDESRAIEIIERKRQANQERSIKVFEEAGIQILKGRFGPYIKKGKLNVSLPKDKDPTTLSLEECEQLIADYQEKKKSKNKGKERKTNSSKSKKKE
jgi:DNA topoisomerase-1